MNLDRRRRAGLPKHLIVVADLDDSSAFALEMAGDRDRESPVMRIWPGEPPETLVDSEVASSVGAFFLNPHTGAADRYPVGDTRHNPAMPG